MSGPTTAAYEITNGIFGDVLFGAVGLSAVVLAAHDIKEAHDIHAEYGEAYQRVREREVNRSQQRKQFLLGLTITVADVLGYHQENLLLARMHHGCLQGEMLVGGRAITMLLGQALFAVYCF